MITEKDTQIFADGKQVVFIFKDMDGSKSEMALELKSPFIEEIQTQQQSDFDNVYMLDHGRRHILEREIADFQTKITFKTTPENVIKTYSQDGGLLKEMDMFKNISVANMFKIINKKLNKRQKNGNN